MMKSYSYLFELLIFLLLITSNILSISAKSPLGALVPFVRKFIFPSPALRKQTGKELGSQAIDTTLQKSIDEFKGSSPSQQVKEIQHLDLVKQYLYEFGYLQQSVPFNNFLDKETISAIKIYQEIFNLQVTGDLNDQILKQIFLPRCGIPDRNFEYSLSDTNSQSWPKGIKWFPEGTKNLTYSFAPESKIPHYMTEVFKNALTLWSTTTKLINFTETLLYNDSNIKIGFYIINDIHKVENLVGDTLISLQLNSNVKSGVIRLDASKSWKDGDFDLESVVMHQIGHLLGLDHSFEVDSIMYPTMRSQQRKVEITVSDNQNIQQLYSNAIKVSANYGSSLLTTLFLGFALMALLN